MVLVAALLIGAGLAFVIDHFLVDALVDDGTFVALAGYPGDVRGPILEYTGWVLLAIGAIVLAVCLGRRQSIDARGFAGALLFGGGTTWFGWTSFDMHVLERYDWPEGTSELVPDLLYHGSGLVVAAVGWFLLAPTIERLSAR